MESHRLCGVIAILLFGCSMTSAEFIVDDIDIDDYLTKYHYMGASNPSAEIAELVDTNIDDARRVGLAMYQMMWGLDVTGMADSATVDMMKRKRCGLPDVENMEDMPNMAAMIGHPTRARRRRRYAIHGSKWPKTDLTYKISEYSRDLSQGDIRRDISGAFQLWAEVTPLTFMEVLGQEQADIDIRFTPRVHGDGFDFDGEGGTLAHAFYPQYGGSSHFDDGEIWTIDTHEGINLFQVAAHEFGHALGLKHSTVGSALMYPFYQGYVEDFTLPQDDIEGIQALYGRFDMTPMPTYAPTQYVPPTMPQGMPRVCENARFDAITSQYIGNKLYAIAFQGSYFMLLNEGGLVEGYPKLIQDHWEGVHTVDAALTLEWEQPEETQQWMYKSVTRLFSGASYYKYINMQLAPGYPKSIHTEWGLPDDIDAMFQWGGNGKIYTIKGEQYYRHNSLQQVQPDAGYPQPLSVWSSSLNHVSAAVLDSNLQTYFFSATEHYRFDDAAFSIAPGYPKNNAKELLGCDTNTFTEDDMNNGRTLQQSLLIQMLALVTLTLFL